MAAAALSSLLSYAADLAAPPPPPPCLDPHVDELDDAQHRQVKEAADLADGAVQVAVLRPGGDGPTPVDGDLLIFHATHRRPDAPLDAPPLATSRGGPPLAAIFGARPGGGPRAPRAFELALASLTPGAAVAVRCRPSYGYGRQGATLAAPTELAGDADADLCCELDLIALHPAPTVTGLDADAGPVHWKVTLAEGHTWETPRAPFEVVARIAARVPRAAAAPLTDAPPFWTDDALTATMGDGSLSPGLEAALGAVCAGERAVVSVDSAALTSGGAAIPLPSPPPTRIELDITLTTMLQVRDLTGDGGVVKRREREGRGEFPADCPLADTVVRVRAAATNEGDDTPFWTVGGWGTACGDDDGGDDDDDAPPPFEFTTGTDAVPSALDKGVRLMTPGERATLVAAPAHAWAGRSDAPGGYDARKATRFDVVLHSFDAPVRDYDATPADRLARATALREQGNAVWAGRGANAAALAAAKWQAAAHELANALDFAEAADEEVAAAAACRATAHANLALAASSRDAWGEAVAWADKALEDDPAHVKALLRKARAAALLGRADVAAAALAAAEAADPGAAGEVARERARAAARAAAGAAKEKKEWTGFLSRQQ